MAILSQIVFNPFKISDISYHCLFSDEKNQSPHNMAGPVFYLTSNSKIHVSNNMASVGHMCWERQDEWEEAILCFWYFDLR